MTDNEAINMVDKAIKSEFFKKCKIGYDLAKALGIVVRIATNAIKNGTPYEERPQGEWIKVKEEIMSVDTVTLYKCSKCERVIATLPSKLAKYYPFCHCGADMRGEKEE